VNNQPKKPVLTLEFRVIVLGISPLIWRHIRINSTSSLTEFHHVLQVISEWKNVHPYQFQTHGQVFNEARETPAFDPQIVTLADLDLRVGETMLYSYRIEKPWNLELRLMNSKLTIAHEDLPVLLKGERSAPDETLKDTRAYLFKRRELELNPPVESLQLAARVVQDLLDHGTRPNAVGMQELENAQDEIDAFIRFTSPGLNLENVNQRLRILSLPSLNDAVLVVGSVNA
jgi:hypothetical protein